MGNKLEGMALIASGIPALVTRWSLVLRKAAIPFALTQSVKNGSLLPDQLEIWVEEDDVEKARAAIIAAENGDQVLPADRDAVVRPEIRKHRNDLSAPGQE